MPDPTGRPDKVSHDEGNRQSTGRPRCRVRRETIARPFDEAFISDLVTGLAAELDGARVQDFVEVLVIKEAMDEHYRLDEHWPAAS